MQTGLRHRVALVTGGSRGIGRDCCRRLAEEGARVAINYRSNLAAAEESAAAVRDAGGEALVVGADVSQAAAVSTMIENIQDHWGPVELLVNNAGVFDHLPFEQTDFEVWQRALNNNLTSVYLVTWAVKDQMIANKYGGIVNISSIAGLRPRPMSMAYSVSKAGLVAFTRSAAAALAEDGIRMTAVAPGLVKTDILDGVDPQTLDQLVQESPQKRLGRPQDVSEAVLFLLSDAADFICGQTLVVDGGRVMLP